MTQTRNATLLATILALTGTAASSDVFIWSGGDGDWNDHGQWFGPANQYPNSIIDTATVSGNSVEALMTSNIAIGSLNILNGADVFTANNSLFVNGDTQINGSSTALAVRPSPGLSDFDSDSIYVRNGGFLIIGGDAKMQADELISIESGSALTGTGTIEMNSPGDLDIVSGSLWAQYNGSDVHSLLVTRTQSSSARLDWTHSTSGVSVWPGITLDVQIPFRGALGGSLSVVGGGGLFRSSDAIITGVNSEFRLSSGSTSSVDSSTIEAPGMDAYGDFRVNGYGTIDTPILALRGDGEMVDDSVLRLDTTVTIFDSLTVEPDGEGGRIEFSIGTDILNIIGGTTAINTGLGGQFDLDGFGNMEININEDSELVLDVEYIERFESNDFDSILNIEGSLDVVNVVQGSRWTNSTGTINLDGGDIHGRVFENDSLVQGFGSITSTVLNRGTIVSDGSTLFFDHLIMGGTDIQSRGVIYAQQGDISNSHNSGGYQYFGGDLYVGDGAGVREVFETNYGIVFSELQGMPSLLSMNSGRIRGLGLILRSEFTTQGTSQLRASGDGEVDWVRFDDTSVNTISGTLEIDGHSRIDAGAEFAGDGTIIAVHTGKTMNFTDGANLQDVGLVNHGALSIGDFFEGVGQASVASLSLESTSKFQTDLAGDNNGIEHDQLAVLDSATLDGVLELSVVDGFEVELGEVFTILTAGSITGEFDHVYSAGLGEGFRGLVTVYPDHVDVMVSCRVDTDGNGSLNFFDVATFLEAFAALDDLADFNEDGVFNFFDVAEFLDLYAAGC